MGELDDWIADGRAVPATVRGPIPMPMIKAPSGEDVAELIRQLRDEGVFVICLDAAA
jgi:hypothetical protein